MIFSTAGLFANEAAARYTKVTVRAVGKGPVGYNSVQEKHSGGKHVLKLAGSGNEGASWMHPPRINDSETLIEEVDRDVQTALQSSASSGQFERDGGVMVKWKRLRGGYAYTILDKDE